MGPPASYRVSRVRYYSGAACVFRDFAYGNFTLFVQLFQNCSAILPESRPAVLNPDNKLSVWPLSRSLAATWEIDVSFSSYGYLDVSVHHVPFAQAIYSPEDICTLLQMGSPIRRSAGQRICAPHRSFSQLVTSFIGSQCQGIHLMLLLT